MASDIRFVDTKAFKKQIQNGGADHIGIRKSYISDVKAVGDKSRTLRFVISTGAVDRDFDTINVAGWDLKHFKKNPVVLFGHDSSRPPIGRSSKIKVTDDKLFANVEFMSDEVDTSGFSDMIFRMVNAGFMNATSVGFMPQEFDFVEDNEKRPFGIDFSKQELMEFSIVPVPSNPEALIEARSAGIDTMPMKMWLDETLDEWAEYKDTIMIPRSQLEKLRKTAEDKRKVYNMSKSEQDDLLTANLERIREQAAAANEELDKLREPVDVTINLKTDSTYTDDGKAHEPDDEDEDEDEEKEVKAGRQTEHSAGHAHTYDETQSGTTSHVDGHTHEYSFGASETSSAFGLLAQVDHTHVLTGFAQTPVDSHDGKSVEDEGENTPDSADSTPKSAKIRLKLVGDGTMTGTMLVDAETGAEVEGIAYINFEHGVGELPVATIDVIGIETEINLPEGTETVVEGGSDEIQEEDTEIDDNILLFLDEDANDDENTDSNDIESEVDEETLTFSNEDIAQMVAETLPGVLKEVVADEIRKIRGKLD